MPKGSFLPELQLSERCTRIQRQRHQKLPRMLSDLPRQADMGATEEQPRARAVLAWFNLTLTWPTDKVPVSAVLHQRQRARLTGRHPSDDDDIAARGAPVRN